MNRFWRVFRAALLGCGALLGFADAVVAQDTAAVVLDSTMLQEDTLAAATDSAVVDTVSPVDSVAWLPVPQPAVPPGPMPPGTRYTFTPDSLRWIGGVTLADLLGAIPGVYVARTGFLGQPEYVMYAGRGAAALEVYWDGLPMVPLGRDSIHIDAGRVNLTYLQRVDVHVLPSKLRVYLVSSNHAATEPRSSLRVMAGDFSAGAYAGLFQKRMPGGFGLNLAADFVGTEGAGSAGRSVQTFDVWGRLDWLPSEKIGASYQLRRQSHKRDGLGSPPLFAVSRRFGARTDYIFEAHAGSQPGGLGLRAESGVASSVWAADSLDPSVPGQTVRQGFFALRYMRPNWNLDFEGRLGDSRTTSQISGRLGWVPLPGIVMAGDARWSRHYADRVSLVANGTLGFYGGPFSLVGTAQYGDAVQAPSLAGDSAQQTLDQSIRFGMRTQPLSGHVAIVWRDPYLPLPFPDVNVLSAFDSTQTTTYLVVDARLATSRALAFEGWYSSPLEGEPGNLQPPEHARVQVTFRSKFWRTFRSGAFDLKIQLSLESWSSGAGGFDESGNPIELPGATFTEGLIQFQLVDFIGFWNFRNMNNSQESYFPGLDYTGRGVQLYGVKWEFSS